MKMKEAGYEIKQGKYLAFRAPDQKHFTNVKTLGAYYAEDSILRRLEKNRHKARTPKPELIRKLADVLEIAPEYLSIPVPSTPEEIKVIEFWQEELSSRD